MRKIKLGLLILGLYFFIAIRLFIFFFVLIYGLNLSLLLPVLFWLILFADVSNLILLWLVGKKILGENYGFLAFLFYAISPWPAYLAINSSIFIFVLFGILLFYFGLTLIKDGKISLGMGLGLLGLVITVYSNFSMLSVLPFLVFGVYKSGLLAKRVMRISFPALTLFLLPIALFLFFNKPFLKQVLTKNVSLFNEVGLINSINTFRGEVNETGRPYLGILIENKITYFSRHVLFNALTTLSPFTYFTPQFKLLGFSLTPPIFLGLIIPFLYGLAKMIGGGNKKHYLLLLTLPLLIPTILRAYSPDLNSLILILPAVTFVSAWGMGELMRRKKWFFVAIVFVLIFLQGLITLYDIKTREPIRYQKTIRVNQ